MAHWFDITLVVLGTILLLFRLIYRIQAITKGVEVLVMICCGAALSLFAPVSPLAGSSYAVPTFLAIGIILGSPLCGRATFAFSMLILMQTLGVALFSVIWHLGLCGASGDDAGWVHPILMTVVVLFSMCLTAPEKVSKEGFEPVLCPMLGSLLVTLGAAGLSPEVQGLTATGLFSPSPCVDQVETTRTLGCWCALFLVGALFSQLLRRTNSQQVEKGAGNDMAKGFIEKQRDGQGDAEGGAINKKELDNNLSRHNVLTKAIFADEGEDMSHLTEHELGLVTICRSDDFERDRFLWGGGLW